MKHLVALLVALTFILGAFGQVYNGTNNGTQLTSTRDGQVFNLCPVDNGTQIKDGQRWVCRPLPGQRRSSTKPPPYTSTARPGQNGTTTKRPWYRRPFFG